MNDKVRITRYMNVDYSIKAIEGSLVETQVSTVHIEDGWVKLEGEVVSNPKAAPYSQVKEGLKDYESAS